MLDRRRFLQWSASLSALALPLPRSAVGAAEQLARAAGSSPGAIDPAATEPGAPTAPAPYAPARIPNEYTLLLPGEAESLAATPTVRAFKAGSVEVSLPSHKPTRLTIGEELDGWRLVCLLDDFNGVDTAILEKHVTHRGVILYATEQGEIARIPKSIGDLSRIRPRPITAPDEHRFTRQAEFPNQPDRPGDYILGSNEDPSYENVAALGAEFIGWTLVANEEAGPHRSLWLEPDGTSRQLRDDPAAITEPDRVGRAFDPRRYLPSEYLYEYVPGYSKRTLLGGWLPVADVGVWNPQFEVGYEAMVLLPPGGESRPIGRVRALLPANAREDLIPAGDSNASQQMPASRWVDKYTNGSAESFFGALVGIWNRWRHFFDGAMQVDIPDTWLADAARAGIVLSRCSYRGLEPTYQIGEGAYTKIPERSHALFPVAHYEFVWAQQLWGLAAEAEPYFEHYLNTYVLPDGNFTYNTQDQVEAPLNAGVFLENSARAYDYDRDLDALVRRLPVLRRMIGFVLDRYAYSLRTYAESDPRHGLIWGSPEADLGDPANDYPASHPWYYQNAAWTWRGLHEHQRILARAAGDARTRGDAALAQALQRESDETRRVAAEMRGKVERSLRTVLDARNAAMKEAGITPFHPFDTTRDPKALDSYENHRFMMDWWTADWGDAALDDGHFRHRTLAGEQLMGMNTDGHYPRTSNFMEHGTLAGRIRQRDYRPFLLALYGNLCYAMDSGSRYAPEDALLPGNHPGEGSPYAWSAVINSTLQPAMGLRWLLCLEEHDPISGSGVPTVHLQKAAPKQWFAAGQHIAVDRCPTRFGELSWRTESSARGWQVRVTLPPDFGASLRVHVHPPDGRALRSASLGAADRDSVLLDATTLAGKRSLTVEIA